MKHLVLSAQQGDPLESMYYAAISIADPRRAERLYKVYRENKTAETYWRDAFLSENYGDTALISAVVNQLGMPFGAYVLERCDSECIELAPWMYSSKFDREDFMNKIFADDVTEEQLRAQMRSLEVIASFVYWLTDYEEKKKKG